MKSKNTERRCILCRFWRGSQAQPMTMKNYYEYSSSEKGSCIQKCNRITNASFSCPKFELDSYKYPCI